MCQWKSEQIELSKQSIAKIKNIRKSRIEKFVQLITEKFA